MTEAAVADRCGHRRFHRNTHDGTHSLLEIGEQRYWGGYAAPTEDIEVTALTLDVFADVHALDRVDILKMDIQGGELSALRGASRLLKERRIGLIATEVEFFHLYKGQPLFWDIGAFLQSFGYSLFKLYDLYYHPKNERVLSWADALFVGPELLTVPEWE